MFFRFFFFKHNTAYEVRISDWSSDVCSSDLSLVRHPPAHQPRPLRDLRSDPGHGELAPHLRRGLALRRRSAEHGARPARRGLGGRAGRRPAGNPAVTEVSALAAAGRASGGAGVWQTAVTLGAAVVAKKHPNTPIP